MFSCLAGKEGEVGVPDLRTENPGHIHVTSQGKGKGQHRLNDHHQKRESQPRRNLRRLIKTKKRKKRAEINLKKGLKQKRGDPRTRKEPEKKNLRKKKNGNEERRKRDRGKRRERGRGNEKNEKENGKGRRRSKGRKNERKDGKENGNVKRKETEGGQGACRCRHLPRG